MKTNNGRTSRGFSLVELLVVISIILIIVAMSLPNILRARMAANEAGGSAAIRTINTSQIAFMTTYPAVGYASTLAMLGPPAVTGCPVTGPSQAASCLIDWPLTNATTTTAPKSGYYFAIGVTAGGPPNAGYTAGAAPSTFAKTAMKGYCSNEDGSIYYDAAHNAAPTTVALSCVTAPYSPMP